MTSVTVVTIFSPIITPSLIPECYKNPDRLPDNSYLGPPSLETWAGEEYLVFKVTLVQMVAADVWATAITPTQIMN